MKTFQCGLLLAILAMTAFMERASAFDIAVYYDARSALNYRCQNEDTIFCGAISRHGAIDNIRNEGDVFNWWDEMGVTHAIVHYPFDDDLLTLGDRDHTDIKILNASYPGETRKYLEAQNRDIYVGNSANDYPNYVKANCWGNEARGDTLLPVFISSRNSLFIQSANAGTMWKPEADLGIWEGWDWHEAKISGKIFMPMHFRIVCNLIPVNNPEGEQEIARLYWLVKHERGWIRYPAQSMTVDIFDGDELRPDTINFTIDPNPGEPGRFQLLDTSFQEIQDSVYDRHSFGDLWGEPVRMWIEYQGDNQIFQVHRVQIWDEGYHQLLMDPTSMDTIEQFIDSVYRRQLNLAPGKMIGWYFDETQQQEAIDPWIRINDILQSGNLPTMYLNGHYGYDTGDDWAQNTWRHKYYEKCDSAGISIPAHMDEYYFLKDGYECQPYNWGGCVPELVHVDSSSDTTYIYADSTECGILESDWMPQQRYEGYKSIQAAIDGTLFGWSRLFQISSVISGPANLFAENKRNMVEQAKYNHSHGSRYWAMLQGYNDGGPNDGCCPIRTPSPNEIKLQAWLSVAADCDGMIWYPVYLGGGLLEYSPLEADYCPGALATEEASVIRTERYFAAKKACTEIHKIAPVLEPLDFVKTYASRAFELNYASCDSPFIERDILRTYGNPVEQSTLEFIRTRKMGFYPPPIYPDWIDENADSTYIQVSRFQTPGSMDEDYWFLIVNRRVLSDTLYGYPREARVVQLGIDNVENSNSSYFVEKMLSGVVVEAEDYEQGGKLIEAYLDPGEAELVHFYKADTSDWVITEPETLLAPAYMHRNIRITGDGSLTIIPNMAVLGSAIGDTTVYDSIATVTFWEGKGIKFDAPGYGAAFRVLGNDTTAIRFQPANADKPWKGIWIKECAQNDIQLNYSIIQGAVNGLTVEGGVDSVGYWVTPYVELDRCTIRDCETGISLCSQGRIRAKHCTATDNENGVNCINSLLVMDTCDVSRNEFQGIGLNMSTGRFKSCTIQENGQAPQTGQQLSFFNGAISAWNSAMDLKCCTIADNFWPGISCYGTTVIMADPGDETPEYGSNHLEGNDSSRTQIYAGNSTLILENGGNKITGLFGESIRIKKWIDGFSFDPQYLHWTDNYWEISDTAEIREHLPSGVVFYPNLTTWESCDDAEQDPSGDTVIAIFEEAVDDFIEAEYVGAVNSYKDVIQQDWASTLAASTMHMIVTSEVLGQTSTNSASYFASIADTTANNALKSAARSAQGWSLAYSGQLDSAQAVLEALLDSAQNDTERVNARIQILQLDLVRQSADTSESVTPEELALVQDSINYLIASLNVWTTTEIINDTLVMYAPCTVRNTISVGYFGRLEIRPTPGLQWAEVRFEDGAYLECYAGLCSPAVCKGTIDVQGTKDCPVVLTGVDSLGWSLIYTAGGQLFMKHAKMQGKTICADGHAYQGGPVIQIDSCEFSDFAEGMMIWGPDSSSYIRNSSLHNMGTDLGWWETGWGNCLTLVENGYITIENCAVENGYGIGIQNVYGTTANILNTTVRSCEGYGILNWDGAQMTMSCSEVTANGDSLPELWVTDGLVDLTSSRSTFADSSGVLVYSADPSYLTLDDGENDFVLWSGDGTYIESGDTTDIWDATTNHWTPVAPTDTTFYDHLYPTMPSKWYVDSSLTSFLACGESGMSYAMLGQGNPFDEGDPAVGTDSWHPANQSPSSKLTDDLTKTTAKLDQNLIETGKRGSDQFKRSEQRKMSRQGYFQELGQWKTVQNLVKSGDKRSAIDAAKRLITEHPSSSLVPASIVMLRSLASKENRDISSFLESQVKQLADPHTRKLAQRMAFEAMAREGQPKEALAGLEKLMDNAETGRDSVQALVSAMIIYYGNRKAGNLQPKHAEVVCQDLRELNRRLLSIARILDDPALLSTSRGSAVPKEYRLYQNYPNPFNPNTEIRFDLPEAVRVELRIYNVLGQEVATLLDGVRPVGSHQIIWDSKNASGVQVASGVYVYQLKAGNFVDSKKMVLIR